MEIYVGNLPFQTKENDLMELFSNYGNVSQVKVILDRETKRSRGFAFVSMADAAEGKKAIEAMNGYELERRNLVVNEAKERQNNNRNFKNRSFNRDNSRPNFKKNY